jgi:hypothetical protein
MPMLDRDLATAGTLGDRAAPPCRYCRAGQDTAPAGHGKDGPAPARLAQTVPAEVLDDLYTRLGMTADEVGRRLGTSRNTVLRSAHAFGGAVPAQGPEEIEMVEALYADPLIAAVLDARDIPRVPPGTPLWQRFPDPVPLTTPLVKDLHWGCGAGLAHIELLTGQPAMTVRGFMRRAGIPIRPADGPHGTRPGRDRGP